MYTQLVGLINLHNCRDSPTKRLHPQPMCPRAKRTNPALLFIVKAPSLRLPLPPMRNSDTTLLEELSEPGGVRQNLTPLDPAYFRLCQTLLALDRGLVQRPDGMFARLSNVAHGPSERDHALYRRPCRRTLIRRRKPNRRLSVGIGVPRFTWHDNRLSRMTARSPARQPLSLANGRPNCVPGAATSRCRRDAVSRPAPRTMGDHQ